LLKFSQESSWHLLQPDLLVASPLQDGTLKRKLILTKRGQNDHSKKSSEETAQRQTVWRQGGNAIKVQMESLVPDLSKITKGERVKEVVLTHVCYLSLKPSRHKLIFLASTFYLNRDKVSFSTGSRHVLWYLKTVFLILDLNDGFFLYL
jgi:hypothetical protein